jgi:hypothetical protein
MNYFRAHFVSDLEVEAPVAYDGARSLPPDRQQLFTEFGLLVDLAMGVTDKLAFKPILVSPNAELAGDPLYASKGFFDVGIRLHDFAQGVTNAFGVWRKVQQRETSQFLKLSNQQIPPVPSAPDRDYSRQTQKVRERLDTVLDSAANTLTDLDNSQ